MFSYLSLRLCASAFYFHTSETTSRILSSFYTTPNRIKEDVEISPDSFSRLIQNHHQKLL